MVDGRRADTEMSLQVGFGGRPAKDAGIGIDEGQILTLFRCKAWTSRRRRHRYMVYTAVMRDKRFVVLVG